ncbi:MAG: acyl carrier protein [Verrucomicrobiales bacterium]|jgi:acyl carrier protein
MNRDELLGKLTDFLNEAMMGRATDITPDEDLLKKGLDSMGAVEFVSQIEDEYGLDEVSPEEITKLKTLNDAADMVLAKLADK